MKIGITCYPTYGGSGIVATELGIELSRRGHEIHFITYANPIRLDATGALLHYHEVEVATYPLFQHQPYTLALASRMAQVAETYRLDLLHVHYAIPHTAAAFLAREILRDRRRLPVITTLHGTDITLVGVERSYFPITKFSIEVSDGVTAISDYLRRQTEEVFGISRHIRVIRNFVNTDQYRPDPEARKQWRFGSDQDRVLIHISNFRPVKRPIDCVRILARVRAEIPAHLVMVGDGPERGPAESMAWELGVQEHVTFLGKQSGVERFLAAADVLLLPSELEGFGLVALEAMSCGVPVVGTKTGGVPEVVTPGVDGYLAPVGDIEAQALAVVALISEPSRYEAFCEAARRAAQERFSVDLLIPEYERFYREVLG